LLAKPFNRNKRKATSALSNLDESLGQRALEFVSRGPTVLTIAHRLSTLMKSEIVLVMQYGRIVQRGSYEELMSQSGPFRQIAAERAM
jgi:ATP-binding cassette subfamily B protein